MSEHKILYSSDMHGNEAQFRAFVDYVLEVKPAIAIIGGELPPGARFIDDNYITMQREFLDKKLPQLLKPVKENLPETKVYITPGNDDCSINDDVLDKYPELYTNIDGKRISLPNGFEIVGYSYVPITPFSIKDREKYDLTNVPSELIKEHNKRQSGYNLRGFVSESTRDGFKWENFTFTDEDKTSSIQKDLENSLFTSNPQRTIYVIHSPPDNTPLDIIKNSRHVEVLH